MKITELFLVTQEIFDQTKYADLEKMETDENLDYKKEIKKYMTFKKMSSSIMLCKVTFMNQAVLIPRIFFSVQCRIKN